MTDSPTIVRAVLFVLRIIYGVFMLDIAIVGATGQIGESLLTVLAERDFEIGELYLFASDSSVGESVSFAGKPYKVKALEGFDFSVVQLAFFNASKSVTEQFAPLAAESGALVIDSTGAFRYDPLVPMIIAGINDERIAMSSQKHIVTNPSPDALMLIPVLKALANKAPVTDIVVTALHSVSGSGKAGVDELAKQTAQLLNARELEKRCYTEQIAFNVLPQVGDLETNGYSNAEIALMLETKIIMSNPGLSVAPSFVRVPVFHGNSASVVLQTDGAITVSEFAELLSDIDGFEVVSGENELATPVSDAVGTDIVYVSRIKETLNDHAGISFWMTADNLRYGSTVNAVKIAELYKESFA